MFTKLNTRLAPLLATEAKTNENRGFSWISLAISGRRSETLSWHGVRADGCRLRLFSGSLRGPKLFVLHGLRA